MHIPACEPNKASGAVKRPRDAAGDPAIASAWKLLTPDAHQAIEQEPRRAPNPVTRVGARVRHPAVQSRSLQGMPKSIDARAPGHERAPLATSGRAPLAKLLKEALAPTRPDNGIVRP